MEEGGQKVQTSSYRKVSIRDVMYNVMTIVNTAVLYIGKLLREWILRILITRIKIFFFPFSHIYMK